MKFASTLNSEAEQRAIMAEVIRTFDATLAEPGGGRQARHPDGSSAAPRCREQSSGSASVSGLERARQLAAQAEDYRTVEDGWEQLEVG